MVEYNLVKAKVEGLSPFFCLVFYLLGLPSCFHRDKVVVVAKQVEGNTKRKWPIKLGAKLLGRKAVGYRRAQL